jgi:hypothetical protein
VTSQNTFHFVLRYTWNGRRAGEKHKTRKKFCGSNSVFAEKAKGRERIRCESRETVKREQLHQFINMSPFALRLTVRMILLL